MKLYHIGPNLDLAPIKSSNLEQGNNNNVVFGLWVTPNWRTLTANHGVEGNVYALEVPKSQIRRLGGLRRTDCATELVLDEKAFKASKVLGKCGHTSSIRFSVSYLMEYDSYFAKPQTSYKHKKFLSRSEDLLRDELDSSEVEDTQAFWEFWHQMLDLSDAMGTDTIRL